jgi:hypothetical protein
VSRPSVSDTVPPVARWHFPPVVEVTSDAPTVDPTGFIMGLADKLGPIVRMAVTVTDDRTVAGSLPSTGFVRGDGMRVAVTVPTDLVGALIGVRCGGPFVPSAAAGTAGASITAEVVAAVLAAADATSPGLGRWQPVERVEAAPTFTLRLTIAGCTFSLPCAIAVAPMVTPSAPDTGDWHRRLAAALDATPFAVRAVLHDRMLPLREALAFSVGDVLPIETRREVSLRLADRALARGRIAPDDDGGHRVTIITAGDAGVSPPTQELP